jgi:hypothetical protein
MIPVSFVTDASLVSSASDPSLSSDSILVKWRPVTAAGIRSLTLRPFKTYHEMVEVVPPGDH